MKKYKRLTTKKYGTYLASCENCGYSNPSFDCDAFSCKQVLIKRLAELEDKIENGTLKKVVRCKNCVYFQPDYVEMENKERRPYTEEEIKNGKFVTIEKGINCGSRCERFNYWGKNAYPVWFNENDFCSYGKLKEQQNDK